MRLQKGSVFFDPFLEAYNPAIGGQGGGTLDLKTPMGVLRPRVPPVV